MPEDDTTSTQPEVAQPEPEAPAEPTTPEPEAEQPEEAPATSTDLVATETEAVTAPPADPYKRIYSPYELPADPYAAKAFIDAHPGDVDLTAKLPPELQTLAEANIQDAVDTYASRGTSVEDPRLQTTN